MYGMEKKKKKENKPSSFTHNETKNFRDRYVNIIIPFLNPSTIKSYNKIRKKFVISWF